MNDSVLNIKDRFHSIYTDGDLSNLINDINKQIAKEGYKKPTSITSQDISFFTRSENEDDKYFAFSVRKKNGEKRIIHAPVKELKDIQTALNEIFKALFKPHKAATGFIPGKSIVKNAEHHVGMQYVFNIDLKDFFPSIDKARLWGRLQSPPFNMKKDNHRLHLANRIAALCSIKMTYDGSTPRFIYEGKHVGGLNNPDPVGVIKLTKEDELFQLCRSDQTKLLLTESPSFIKEVIANVSEKVSEEPESEVKYVLPQGAPTSPTISNIICKKLDDRLSGLAKKYGCKYSRYADDITFSSMNQVFQKNSMFRKKLVKIIKDEGFRVNGEKVRLQENTVRQEVTGLVVNEKVNLKRRYVKEIRMWIYYWEKYGYEKAQENFRKDYSKDRGYKKGLVSSIRKVLRGKLDYMKMVKGVDDPTYQKLRKRFDRLVVKEKQQIEIDNLFTDTNGVNFKPKYPRTHSPQEFVDLLAKFSSNDNPLKYTTHSWDEGAYNSYSQFMKEVNKAFGVIGIELKNLSDRTYAKCNSFLFNPNLEKSEGWGFNGIKIGWSSKELKEWCLENPNSSPFDFRVPRNLRKNKNDVRISTFEDVVFLFKNEIEIRDEGDQLKKLINEMLDKTKLLKPSSPFKVTQLNLEQKTFYVDVQWFKASLIKIFQSFSKRPKYPEIEISVNDSDFHIELLLMQKESYSEGLSVSHQNKLTKLSGDFDDLFSRFKNQCDWAIESKFKEGYKRLNYLVSEHNIPFVEDIDGCEGFTYRMKFYKSRV